MRKAFLSFVALVTLMMFCTEVFGQQVRDQNFKVDQALASADLCWQIHINGLTKQKPRRKSDVLVIVNT